MFWKLMELLSGVAGVVWLLSALYHSFVGNYDYASYALLWSIACTMTTRFDRV
jgi:hypothetical protein